MFMRILAPERHQPVPVAGTFLSLTAHVALASAVLAGGSAATGRDDGASRPAPTEQLHWVGVGEGSGRSAARPRPGARPPIAYVVPGRGPMRALAARDAGGREAAGHTAGPAGGAGTGPRGTDGLRGSGPGERRPVPGGHPRTATVPKLALPTFTVPSIALPSEEAMRLVAGVLSAAPDFARRIARPEDFAPASAPPLLADLLARTGVTALAMMATDVHVHDLPIPLVDNPRPAYPLALAQARVGGRVVVEFLIDSTGAVDVGSLHVVQSTDVRFTQAVRSVLPQLRFMPAQFGEHPVGVTVRQPFLFTLHTGL